MTASAGAAVSGMGLGFSLIAAIGAQNAFVLRQGLRREHLAAVIAICVVSDVVLVAAGVIGAAALLARVPGLLTVARVAGAIFLLGYALVAARRALRTPSALDAIDGQTRSRLASAVATALALTWLNPHVYLDTVVLLGTIAASHGGERWWFAAGAALASGGWFTALGYGARLLRPIFVRPLAWRVLDGVVAITMTALASSLLLDAR